ncbi:MAG: Phosphoribosylanthranilate isomerase [Anaerosporomusa subterranea]|nr:Phosphoribosylanthranilate isomerase [Anaerosporomusa subterranea]
MIRIKICGLQDIATALAAAEAGADAIGMVFAPSKRQVQPTIAREICQALPPFVSKVGVFVDAKAAVVKEIVAMCGLDTLQFHGQETADYCSQFPQTVIKAFQMKDQASLAKLSGFRNFTLLLDSYSAGQMGGTGHVFPWELARKVSQEYRIILAGGLSTDNVLAAIRAVQPFAVDVSSGVESNGVKDSKKIKEFITTIRRWEYHGSN